jgi:hypothetical protein
MSTYPYYNEPTHDQGAVITLSSTNAGRDTSTSLAEQRLIVDAVDKIFLLEPNKHPLVTLLTNVGKVWDGKAWKGSGMLKRATGNPEFKWFEDFYGGRYATVGASYNSTDNPVTITVSGAGSSSAYIFTVGDVIKNARTGENLLVASIASATTITATRAFGTTAAASGNSGDGLFIIGNANEENSGARNVNTTRSTPQTNYTQIFKTTIGLSNTEKEANLYGGKDLPYQRAKKGTEHALDIERAFWWGQKTAITGVQGKPKRGTGGVLEFINSGNSYVQNQGGALTAPDFNTFLREGFTYGNDTKCIFAGGIVLQAINEIARGQILMQPVSTTYGMKISTWVTAFGTVNIVHNPLFVQDYAGYAFMMDMESFAYRFMNNRDTSLKTNIQAPDADGEVDEYLTECGLQREQAAKHALILGVTS